MKINKNSEQDECIAENSGETKAYEKKGEEDVLDRELDHVIRRAQCRLVRWRRGIVYYIESTAAADAAIWISRVDC